MLSWEGQGQHPRESTPHCCLGRLRGLDGEPGTSLPSRLGTRGHSCSWSVEVSRVSKAMNVSVAMSDTVTKTSSQDAKECPSPPAIPVLCFLSFLPRIRITTCGGGKKK